MWDSLSREWEPQAEDEGEWLLSPTEVQFIGPKNWITDFRIEQMEK